MIDPLLAISPLDGRYRDKIKHLESYFSESALIRYRVFVEIEWFIFLCNEVRLENTRILNEKELKILRSISTGFEVADARRVKEFEAETNHDVKAMEYYIKEHLLAYPKLAAMGEFIHFGCTSEDINNLAYSLLLKDFVNKEFLPLLSGIIIDMHEFAKANKSIAMLAHTHGQPATPTTLGKEIINVVSRLSRQFEIFKKIEQTAKMNGAVGNWNAHCVAYPKVDWISVSHRFITYLGLSPNHYTTQIEPHDNLAETFDSLARINTVLMDFCRDIWMYISFGYLKQKPRKGEVGSSTMPHKINPIDFENAEGNLGMANAFLKHFSEKLPVSRMQRDLSDSTVMRNIGVAFGYSVIAYKSILNGLNKIEVNEKKLNEDLADNLEVLAEAIQTVLRKNGIKGAYEKLKELTRGRELKEKNLQVFINKLKIPKDEKKRLLSLTPESYIGLAVKLVDNFRLKI